MAKRKAEEQEPFILPDEVETEAGTIVQAVTGLLFTAQQSGEPYVTGQDIRTQLGAEFEPLITKVSAVIGEAPKNSKGGLKPTKGGKGWMKKLLSLEPTIECVTIDGEDQPCYRVADGSPIPAKKNYPKKEAREAKGAAKGAATGAATGVPKMVDAKLNKWVEAKRSKDFATADALKAELQGMGYNPEELRPKGYQLPSGGNQNTGAQPNDQMAAMAAMFSQMPGGKEMLQMAKMMGIMPSAPTKPKTPASPFGNVGNLQKGALKGAQKGAGKGKDQGGAKELPANLKDQGELVIQAAINFMMVNMDESGLTPGGRIVMAVQQEQPAAVEACKGALGGKGWLKKLLATSENIEVDTASAGEPCYKLIGF